MKKNIGFIGGGRMAEALIQGICKAKIFDPKQILVADPVSPRRKFLESQYGVSTYEKAVDMVSKCDVVILAVKPQVMGVVLASVRSEMNNKHLVISIAAGITLSFIEECLNGCNCRLVRVMPNTPALVQEGASALSLGVGANDDDLNLAKGVFDAVGKSIVVTEPYLDAVTGLSGSGPAYVFTFIEAMIDAGVKVGLNRDDAQVLVLQTLLGSVKLAMESDEHPAQLRAMVTSPGGTTIAGLHEMARAGFNGIVMDAVQAATDRSKELGS